MAHACGCRHGSSRDSAASPAPVGPEETVGEIVPAASVGMSVGTVLAALNEGRKAPA